LKPLIFISSMGIDGDLPDEPQRCMLDPYPDSAALIEASDLDYTVQRPGRFNQGEAIDYRLTLRNTAKAEPAQCRPEHRSATVED
jgi:hypothetical protein